MPAVPDDLATTLRRLAARLEALPASLQSGVAVRARERLQRDLLPRTAGGPSCLIAGVVGPNNSGKSALFNALIGADWSPSLPTGGATRRLLGAAHPALVERLQAAPAATPFRIVAASGAGPAESRQPAADPSELLVASPPGLPDGFLLIDTPDFDSILHGNRASSEALLAVTDLAVVVVTRHSYQNREVVTFLERWLAHGRPWILVYNEGENAELARLHAARLSAGLEAPPLACFWMPLDLAIQRGERRLDPSSCPLDGGERRPAPLALAAPAGQTLRSWLFALQETGTIKRLAMQASLQQLRDDLQALSAMLRGAGAQAYAAHAALRDQALWAGDRIASAAMPAAPLIAAFRSVLDQRSNPLSRGLRGGARRLRGLVEKLPTRWKRTPAAPSGLLREEQRQLERCWPQYWEELARGFGAEARHPARIGAGPALVESLSADLDPARGPRARQAAFDALSAAQPALDDYQERLQDIVREEIERRGSDRLLQVATDLVVVAPVALAGLVIKMTGGLGADLAVGSSGLLSSLLAERFSHLVGSEVLSRARECWRETRRVQIGELLLAAALPATLPALRTLLDDCETQARELDTLSAKLA